MTTPDAAAATDARGHGAAALEVCAGCPVRRECADYAVAAGPRLGGVWGGLTAAERARIRQGAA